ncbi:hypothetical protein BKA70DRAFT_1272879 [Coprinopsis sp. MPI-PUGE-AT-0042]|nr:hypothetical protein BKA70DRAFT_1272879 [Coprinopsis sp. MPI-PUGE-AT-0042]
MDKLPAYHDQRPRERPRKTLVFKGLLAAVILATTSLTYYSTLAAPVPLNAQSIVDKCKGLTVLPGPPSDFHERKESDRYVLGTPPVLIRNATLWTGHKEGKEVLTGDLLLEKGIITAGDAPELSGADDTNSVKGLTFTLDASVDGLNTHDEAYHLSISGGVTTANILPGSADAIGGQAFTIKLRPTQERTTTAMLLEPPFSLNATGAEQAERPRWRQMKWADQNPGRVYEGTRMDTQWAFRNAYETARKIKVSQDEYCSKAILALSLRDLQWEPLVEVLRGRVKVHNHCYEAVDLDNMVRLTHEWPACHCAICDQCSIQREAYRGSEFAPRVLAANGLKVVMKSDHPVLDSRFLLNEAQQAHYYGLPEHLALSSVISTPAVVLGYDHRVGFLRKSSSTGIAQLKNPHTSKKPVELQSALQPPNFDDEVKAALEYEGLQAIAPHKLKEGTVIFKNVFDSELHRRRTLTFVAVREGSECPRDLESSEPLVVNLEGGSISYSCLISFGSLLGIHHIDQEDSTNDGEMSDSLTGSNSGLLGEGASFVLLMGLLFETRATVGVTAPTWFDAGAPHKLAKGAIVQNATALHVSCEVATYFAKVAKVIDVQSADIMATLIELKAEVDSRLEGKKAKFTFVGANEAHLLAKEIGQAGVGVILSPALPKILQPLFSPKHNVTVGLGIVEHWQSRNIRFDVGWPSSLRPANLEQLLGLNTPNLDLVAVKHGSLHGFEGQVVGIISPRQAAVNLV